MLTAEVIEAFGLLGLVPVFLLVLLFAKALLYQAGERRRSIIFAFSFALLSVGPTLISRAVGNLVWSAFLFAGLCAVGVVLLWRRGPPVVVPPAQKVRLPFTAWLLVGGMITLVAWVAIDTYLWDEHSGHFGLVSVLARGIVPAQHPVYPGDPFRYHYAFDVLAALVRAFSGLSVAVGIDLMTIACFVLLVFVAKDIGYVLTKSPLGAFFAMLLVPLGSGALQFLLIRDGGALEFHWSALPEQWARSMPPPVISNFFQHPQGFGMSLSLAVLMLFSGDDHPPLMRRRRVLVGALLLGMLSLAHVVFFSVMGLAVGASVLFHALRTKNFRALPIELLCLLGSLGLARLIGGFLEPGPEMERVLVFGKSYFGDPALRSIVRHLVLFGVPLLGLPLAIVWCVLRPRPILVGLLVAAVLGFSIPNFVIYGRSWDIVKFFGVGNFFANVLLAGLLVFLLKKPSTLKIVLVAFLVTAGSNTSWYWLYRSSVFNGVLGVPPWHFPGPSHIGEVAGEALYPYMGHPEERVFSTNVDVGMAAGLLLPGFDWRMYGSSYMIDRKRFERELRHRRMARRHLRKADMDALKVKWMVLSPGDIGALSKEGKKNLEDPKRFEFLVEKKAGGQQKRLYRVLSGDAIRSNGQAH